ncbi:divalent metal cation transporter MntH [Paractinoplanes abujensis]|uniref:Manganese transport protein n=1 Tax=Paractinoplanes abujensis TaxID=882441 RepID=A0A7W7CL94_9ACTN|nr:Nramp family divalent metal transporter [Actinoplanes abujensis]MBB4690542.1 manganese transport protein [Actinoplanes abujensis]GID24913.1 divalent metal cation transporter MntH [Actinoplanes abujensis]
MAQTQPITYAVPSLGRPGARPVRLRAATTLGPAFVAAIAYVDPGNFATNFAGGASTGYQLVWVVVLANLVAMPIQFMSAKLGVATGRSLPHVFRDTFPGPRSWVMWGQAEIVAMATDLAEFVGAAIGLYLLFGIPMPLAAGITAVISFAVLSLQHRGYRPFELAIGAMLAMICAGFLYLAVRVPPSASESLTGLLPSIGGDNILLLAVGIIGATVMPHAIYLHSGLMCGRAAGRTTGEKRRLLRLERVDIAIAMSLAGLVNLSMLAIAAKLFHRGADTPAITLDAVHIGLDRLVGGGAALAFAAALLASGIASSSVGTAAGQMVMDGFLRARIPLTARRLVTMTPAVALLCSGVDPTQALVLSQVVLSFGIPFALVGLLVLTSRKSLMGEHVNSRLTIAGMTVVVAVLSGLNVLLLGQQLL